MKKIFTLIFIFSVFLSGCTSTVTYMIIDVDITQGVTTKEDLMTFKKEVEEYKNWGSTPNFNSDTWTFLNPYYLKLLIKVKYHAKDGYTYDWDVGTRYGNPTANFLHISFNEKNIVTSAYSKSVRDQ